MKCSTITAQEFASGMQRGVYDRMLCLECGVALHYKPGSFLTYYEENWDLADCDSAHGAELHIPCDSSMDEITQLFYACGYAISSAGDRVETLSGGHDLKRDTLRIDVIFSRHYELGVFHDLPECFEFCAAGDLYSSAGCAIVYCCRNFERLTDLERELVRDDALQLLYDWVRSVYTSEIYKVWRLAELL